MSKQNRVLLTSYFKALVAKWYVVVALIVEVSGLIILGAFGVDVPRWIFLASFGVAFIASNYLIYRKQEGRIEELREHLTAQISLLQEELQALKNRLPILELLLSHEKAQKRRVFITVSDPPPRPDYDALVEAESLALKEAYDASESNDTPRQPQILNIPNNMMDLLRGDRKSRKEYENDCEGYLKRYRAYLQHGYNHAVYLARYRELSFVVRNTGTVPAEDVTVLIDFPDEFSFPFEAEDQHYVWVSQEEPQQPSRPSLFKPSALEVFQNPRSFPVLPNFFDVDAKPVIGPSDVSGPSIRPKNSTEVSYEIRSVMHNFEIALDAVGFFVKEQAIGHSWELPYSIHAANLPQPIEGSLVIEVQRN